MWPILNELLRFIAINAWGVFATFSAIFAAAAWAYAREQVQAGTKWALFPITKAFPWNANPVSGRTSTPKVSQVFAESTLVEVFLCDSSGRFAIYKKTSNYRVLRNEFRSYHEGVTAEGVIDSFSTMRGSIVKTFREHGFYLSRIDLTDPIQQGSTFTNVYKANMHHSFVKSEEHWSQELACPTRHLTVHIHFPADRPPKSIACKMIQGNEETFLPTGANLVELFGKKSVVWEIDEPHAGDIIKVEWIW